MIQQLRNATFSDMKTSLFFADVLPTNSYAKTSTSSPGETAITRSSVSSVYPVTDDHCHQPTSVTDPAGRGKFLFECFE